MNASVGIFTNCNKDVNLTVTRKLLALLSSYDYTVYLHKEISQFGLTCEKVFDENDGKYFDVMLTVGGDGTILRIASYCAKYGIKILGVNLGNVGFLTEIEVGSIDSIPVLLDEGELDIENRSMLLMTFGTKEVTALNDIVLNRYSSDRMIGVSVSINGKLADKYCCDGYIVSTPTGSTAYSLSAGGCILSPDAKAFSLLPINSHSLHSRPIVVSNDAEISVKLLSASDSCTVLADGQSIGKIDAGTELLIGKANRELSFLRLKTSNFYEKLLSKLNSWSVTLR